MSYIINNSRGQIVAVVDDGTVNTTATDLALIGRSVTNYGEYQNENYVYLLENFANSSAPLQPILGQLWYNSATDTISAYSTENTWTALASQPYVDAQKISPAFTGTPTAPTASVSTNTTQLATTAFVQNNKISPAFTGTPTAPTASNGTSTTQIATTAYVQNQLSSSSGFTTVGTITGGNLVTGGIVSAVGNITGGNVNTGNVNTNNVNTGIVSAAGNITGGNLLSSGVVSVSGNVIGANFIGNVIPPLGSEVSTTGNITGGNVISGGARVYKYTASATVPSNGVPGDNWYATNTDKLYLYINDGTSSQWVDQSFPTSISSLAINGNLSVGGTLTVANITLSGGGSFSVSNLLNSGANGTGNIGNSTNYFNQVFATATTALYADLAENYQADGVYKPGTVVVFGGKNEITVSDIDHDTRIAGVVSTNPAYLMNSSQADGTPVALAGRVPCFVQGPVIKGDRLVNVASGIAGKFDPVKAELGCVVGKSLQDLPHDHVELIEIAVGRT